MKMRALLKLTTLALVAAAASNLKFAVEEIAAKFRSETVLRVRSA
jgi:hypothetical protein